MLTSELHRLMVAHLLFPHAMNTGRSICRGFSRCAAHGLRSSSVSTPERRLILGLESSADDTCASVLSSTSPSSQPTILSNIVIRQFQIHEQHGGIHPLYAQHAHGANMPIAIQRALKEAQVELNQLDAISFTRGPGMMGCLNVAAQSAKALAAACRLPLVGVHHMQAHALTPFLTSPTPPPFPFLTLLLSGGHTLLLLASSETKFKILATTHDESIGASFDKASRDLQIPWSLGAGSPGAALEAFAIPPFPSPSSSSFSIDEIDEPFAIPFRRQLAFSFSGARSQFDRILLAEPVDRMEEGRKRHLARSFMTAAVRQVEEKVALSLEGDGMGEVKALVVSGGVASNMFLRKRLREKLDELGRAEMELVFPPPSLCTDNAAMIANVGLSRLYRGRLDPLDVMPISKWSIEECEKDFE